MNTCTDGEALIKRLRRVEGQIRGIIKMVEEDKPCEDILVQISSAKAAMHSSGRVLLEDHLKNCVTNWDVDGNLDEMIGEFTTALNAFSKIS